jgi:hypothetical protein
MHEEKVRANEDKQTNVNIRIENSVSDLHDDFVHAEQEFSYA